MRARFVHTSAATALGTLLSACAPAGPAPAVTAEPAPVMTTLLTRLGRDTLSVEQYTRSDSRIDGVLATHMPFAALSRYRVQLDADGAPASAEYGCTRGDGTPVPGSVQPVTLRYGRDSVTISAHRAGRDTVRTIAARGMLLPYLGESWGLFELAFARMLAARHDSATFQMLPLSFNAAGTTALPVRLYAADSVRLDWFGDPMYARHDARGGLVALDGRRTTDKVRVERIAAADVAAIARRWSAVQGAGGATEFASTRDTARATIGAAHVWVDYGRPSLRGRDVWAGGVLGDTLWRTGANAATQLGTDGDLVIGGYALPRGTYSLFTLATAHGYELIVNAQSGQWGTEHDAARDLVRLPLQVTDGSPSIERFTITIEPAGANAASLVLAWGSRRLSVPVTSR